LFKGATPLICICETLGSNLAEKRTNLNGFSWFYTVTAGKISDDTVPDLNWATSAAF